MRLKEQIQKKVPSGNDQYQFHTLTMPFVEAAVNGEIERALDEDKVDFVSKNFNCDDREDNLPPEYDREFLSAVAEFSACLQGMLLEETDEVIKDGVTYRWLEKKMGTGLMT